MTSSALVSLFVCQQDYTQKLLDRFSENSVERWHMGHGRKRQNLVQSGSHHVRVSVRVMVMLGLRLGGGRVIPRKTGYVLSGVFLIVTILRNQLPWRRYGILGFNVPLDTVYVISETGGGMRFNKCYSSYICVIAMHFALAHFRSYFSFFCKITYLCVY